MPRYVLFRRGHPATRYTTTDDALRAYYALSPSDEKAVLCGEREDGRLGEAIARVGTWGPTEAREWALGGGE